MAFLAALITIKRNRWKGKSQQTSRLSLITNAYQSIHVAVSLWALGEHKR